MGVFPAASGKFLPLSFRALMSEKVKTRFSNVVLVPGVWSGCGLGCGLPSFALCVFCFPLPCSSQVLSIMHTLTHTYTQMYT